MPTWVKTAMHVAFTSEERHSQEPREFMVEGTALVDRPASGTKPRYTSLKHCYVCDIWTPIRSVSIDSRQDGRRTVPYRTSRTGQSKAKQSKSTVRTRAAPSHQHACEQA